MSLVGAILSGILMVEEHDGYDLVRVVRLLRAVRINEALMFQETAEHRVRVSQFILGEIGAIDGRVQTLLE